MTDVRPLIEPPPDAGLAPLLRRQHELYRRLRGLSDQQRQALEHGSTQGLLTVLGQRQSVVDELSEVAGELSAVGDRWSSLVEALGEEERRELQGLTREVQRLAEEVMQRDEDDQTRLRGMRRDKGEELGAMHSNRAAAAAYRGGGTGYAGSGAAPNASAGRPTPRFADRDA